MKFTNQKSFLGIAKTSQRAVKSSFLMEGFSDMSMTVAKVVAIYSDRMTCDVQGLASGIVYNVPVLTNAGMIAEEVYGKIELPEIDDTVIIAFLNGNEGQPFIIGSVIPYIFSKWQSGQVPVNSASKAFTKKLLEVNKPKTYKRVFKSGTSLEIQEDGSVILETPSGTVWTITEASAGFKLQDSSGNVIEATGSSVKINNNLEVLQ